jgi:DNA-3-methyladenine glycosylase II
LRGLGRMDEVPLDRFEDPARAIYGDGYDVRAIARRYGDQIGYWSFYLKTGVARSQEKSMAHTLRRSPSRTVRSSAA